MIKLALFARLEATPIWFGPTTFGVFDAVADEASRQAHLAGSIAQAWMAQASELLACPPSIEPITVPGLKNQLAQ